jgi:hypothetical protein
VVHGDKEVNSFEKFFEKTPGDVRVLLPKTRVYDEIQHRARRKGFYTWRVWRESTSLGLW